MVAGPIPVASVPILTIDGPSGSGKGTIARRVADRLGWHLLDSGALYRLVGLAGQRRGLARDDQAGHERVAQELEVKFGLAADGGEQIWLEGQEVSGAIRTEAGGRGRLAGGRHAGGSGRIIGPPAGICRAAWARSRRPRHGHRGFPLCRPQDIPDSQR